MYNKGQSEILTQMLRTSCKPFTSAIFEIVGRFLSLLIPHIAPRLWNNVASFHFQLLPLSKTSYISECYCATTVSSPVREWVRTLSESLHSILPMASNQNFMAIREYGHKCENNIPLKCTRYWWELSQRNDQYIPVIQKLQNWAIRRVLCPKSLPWTNSPKFYLAVVDHQAILYEA